MSAYIYCFHYDNPVLSAHLYLRLRTVSRVVVTALSS